MLPCFLGSLQLPDVDCKVSWELPRFRIYAPSENLWSFEEHFCFFIFSAWMHSWLRWQETKTWTLWQCCACQRAQTTQLHLQTQFSKLPRQTIRWCISCQCTFPWGKDVAGQLKFDQQGLAERQQGTGLSSRILTPFVARCASIWLTNYMPVIHSKGVESKTSLWP